MYELKEIDGFKKLYKDSVLVMSDNAYETEYHKNIAEKMTGNILIGGLGIGLILDLLKNRDDIKSITVIEHSQELIDYILPKIEIESKVKIIVDDVYKYKIFGVYDYIYMDIWFGKQHISKKVVYDEYLEIYNKYKDYTKQLDLWEFDNAKYQYEMFLTDEANIELNKRPKDWRVKGVYAQ